MKRNVIPITALAALFTLVFAFGAAAAPAEDPTPCAHESVFEEVTVPPTCTKEGQKTVKCNVCLETWEELVPPLGHAYKESGGPTCTEAGETTYTCGRCGDSFKEYAPALGHDYKEKATTATCTQDGTALIACTRCGDSYTEARPALGHDYKTEETPAACTAAGKTVRTCARCGDVITEDHPALGHDFGEWTVKAPATWVNSGEETRVCARCGETESRVLPRLTHLAADECPAGDVDMNGKVTAADARLVLRRAVRFDDGLDDEQIKRCDFDENGKINAFDARCVLRVAVKLDPFTAKQPETETDPAPDNKPETPALAEGYTFAGYTSKGYTLATKDGVTYVVSPYGYTLIANKTYALPANYTPYAFPGAEPTPDSPLGLTPECRAAFAKLQSGAKQQGYSIWLLSGYRSYNRQKRLYNNYVAQSGKAAADTYSARPGHSEHQTGLAMDVNSLKSAFGNTSEGRWLAANAYKYGFIIRYPYNKQSVTGYIYEPWHIRYVGEGLAAELNRTGLTLEEYFGITSQYK